MSCPDTMCSPCPRWRTMRRPDQFTLARLYPALKHCLKPVRITSRDLADASGNSSPGKPDRGRRGRVSRSSVHHAPLLPGGLAADDGHVLHRDVDVLRRGQVAGVSDHRAERRADFADVDGGHAGAGQCRVPGGGRPDANGAAGHAADLRHTPHGRGHAHGRLCLRAASNAECCTWRLPRWRASTMCPPADTLD